jgi:hypothetical protein
VTSSYLGLAVLDVFLLAAGMGLLYGVGLVRSGRDALRNAGLALVAGWAAVGIIETTALVLGAPLTRWVVASIAVAIAAVGVLVGRRISSYRLRVVGEPGPGSWLAVAGAAVVFVDLAALLRRALGGGAPLQWDAWSFWLPKAKSIVDFGGLDTGVGGFTSFANPGYPPFVPSVEASAFAFMGNTNASPLALQHWVIATAFFAALASLLAVRVRPAILWPCLALLALLPTFTALIGSSLGDEPMVIVLGLGGACAALWLLEREARYAALAALFLAAGALAKNEGLFIAEVLALTVLVAALARRPRQALAPAFVVLAPLAAIAPWRLWLRHHNLRATYDYRLSDAFHPSLLGDRIDRLSYAAHRMPGYVFSPGHWLLAVPLMLAAAVLAAPRRPALSVLALVSAVAAPAALLVIYWIGYPPVDWYVATTAERGVSSTAVLAAVFLPLLLSEASNRDRQSP